MDSSGPDTRRIGDHGSTLLIFPAAVLVLLILTSIAVDLSGVHLAQRQLSRSLSQAADDAASAVDTHRLRADGVAAIDRSVAVDIALAHLASESLHGELSGDPVISFGDDGRSISISATARVPLPFASGVPGAPRSHTVRATGVGHLVRTGDAP